MFRTLFLMLLLLVGLISGPYLAGNQGYVRIETATTVIEMSIVMLVVFFVLAMAVVYLLEWIVTKICRMSNGAYNWFSTRKHKKAQQETLEGLMRMSEGNYSKAEKLFSKNAKHADEPVLNLIKAAEAAQQNGDDLAANKYLIKATEIAGPNNVAVELVRTRILLQQGKLPAARTAIDSLLELAPHSDEVLRLAIQIYKESRAYVALDRLLVEIGQRNFLTAEEYAELEYFVDDGLQDERLQEEGQEGLLSWWENQPNRRRKSVYSRVGVIKRLIDSDDHQSAQEIALETLKKFEDEQLQGLFVQLTRLQIDSDSKLLKVLAKRADKANVKYTDDYARALGYIYTRDGQYQKAKSQFELLLAHDECVADDRIMALHVAEQMGDTLMANRIREENLKQVNMATQSKVNEPLALPQTATESNSL
ncbi:TPA: heme biosynthesis protein HemY [Mannheimia haemolytica]|uniref:Heme biosynthesis protein HemY n=5 Tax=Mannheimia haemolytica TaxID=75985 RepID=A0A248ZYH8_MANHA|nr:heme biosynthesis HemY N-terminal domain-containing protein [Mannheimia haemolytica]AWW71016.1 heme biosynthesis protein HemY [Pasteurellaceae bacterium 12565]AGI32125.2 heme biosynthesis protein HemY [Mannheimia haemolytica USDA-ARS-USMARC-183]AGI35762.2 heme biosynthesis protein HemY [Mannheimia haemolytica USDA-ARS-USMARC-185]AGK03047.1 protoheme IX synthesis protein HemY [Mannheimia haemolytica M42548]AGQ25132.1 heme biosynthesis protein HemY [Mannheimia haemolytica D153]